MNPHKTLKSCIIYAIILLIYNNYWWAFIMKWNNIAKISMLSLSERIRNGDCGLCFKRRALQIVILFLGLYPRLPMHHCAISSKGVFENDSETNPHSILLHSRVTLFVSVFLLRKTRKNIIITNNYYMHHFLNFYIYNI